jgi:hypothetical protein
MEVVHFPGTKNEGVGLLWDRQVTLTCNLKRRSRTEESVPRVWYWDKLAKRDDTSHVSGEDNMLKLTSYIYQSQLDSKYTGVNTQTEIKLFVINTNSRSRFLLEVLVAQLFKDSPTLHENWNLLTMITRSRHWRLSWIILTQSTPSKPI